MILSNSYVFILNPYSKKKETSPKKDGVIYTNKTLTVSYHIRKIFNLKNESDFSFDTFKITYSFDLYIGGEEYPVTIKLHDVSKNTYANISVNAKNKLQCVKCLEYINKQLENVDLNNDYIVIISYDAISEFYCNKIYPKLNELERNIRKLLFNIYTLHFGGEYYKSTTSLDMQNKIKGLIQASGSSSSKEVERIKKFFYSMEFTDVQQLLFSERWTIVEEKAKENFLKTNSNLNELDDSELRQALETFIPKSDWERFFKDKADGEIVQKLINEVRVSRNSIAHCKFFYNKEYVETKKVISELNKCIVAATRITEEKDFSDKNYETITLIAENIAKTFESYKEMVSQVTVNVSSALIKISESTTTMATTLSKIFECIIEISSCWSKKMLHLLESFPDSNLLEDELIYDNSANLLESDDNELNNNIQEETNDL